MGDEICFVCNRFERFKPIKLLVTTFDNSNTYWNCHFIDVKDTKSRVYRNVLMSGTNGGGHPHFFDARLMLLTWSMSMILNVGFIRHKYFKLCTKI